jgi:class 3 adenylate cyclase/alpha-beta hydrolase superfamily lysophospholipase
VTQPPPVTQYAWDGAAHAAFQQFGSGSRDLVLVHEWLSHQELRWEQPELARFLERLGGFARVLSFDKRGCGLSDPVTLGAMPSLEEWADDVITVMDAAGVERATLMGMGAGGPMTMLVAASRPERVDALVLVNTTARYLRAPDYPHGVPRDAAERLLESVGRAAKLGQGYPPPADAALLGHARAGDSELREWLARYRRVSVSPATWVATDRLITETDVRGALPAIRVPTLVLHRRENKWTRVEHGRYLAQQIPDARLVELAGDEQVPYVGDVDALLGEIEEFVTGARAPLLEERALATMLFVDIVDSTATAAAMGDGRWRGVIDRWEGMAERQLQRYRGRRIQKTGDGMLATFDGPARAVRCAMAIRDATQALELRVRTGLHAGEVELRGDDIGGIAVHLAARICAQAGPDEVLVSSTVADLVAGSELAFTSRGRHALKGIPREWELLAAEHDSTRAAVL